MIPSFLTLALLYSLVLARPSDGLVPRDPSAFDSKSQWLSAREAATKAMLTSRAPATTYAPVTNQPITLTPLEEETIQNQGWVGTGGWMLTFPTAITSVLWVPELAVPSGGNPNARYTSLVSMGWGCGSELPYGSLGIGFMMVLENGKATYQAFRRWLPDEKTQFWSFDELSLKPGDALFVRTISHQNTTATVILENQLSGQKVSYTYTNQRSALCSFSPNYSFQQITNLVEISRIYIENVGATYHTLSFDGGNPEYWYSNVEAPRSYNNTKATVSGNYIYVDAK